MTEETYRYRDGFSFGGIAARVAAAELERLSDKDGAVRARAIVVASRPGDAVLHKGFEWNDAKAGEQYRIIQARGLIRAIVRVTTVDAPVRRAYVHVTQEPEREGSYRLLAAVGEDEGLFERAFAELNRKFLAARQALEELEEVGRGSQKPERMAAIALAVKGFDAVQEALRVIA